MRGALKVWVRVPQIKGPLMCSTCGKRGMRYALDKKKLVNWCSDTGKSCLASARHCAGAFIREDKVKKTLKTWESLYYGEDTE